MTFRCALISRCNASRVREFIRFPVFLGINLMMGKSVTSKLRNLAKSVTQKTDNLPKPRRQKNPQNHRPIFYQKQETEMLEADLRRPLPLAMVVSDCARRWFKDTVKEAQTGKISMQVLLGQMYYSGYGVPRNREKLEARTLTQLPIGQCDTNIQGQAWIARASRTRPFICDIGKKRPGYVESDSDTDEAKR